MPPRARRSPTGRLTRPSAARGLVPTRPESEAVAEPPIHLTVNGEDREVPRGITVDALLETLEIQDVRQRSTTREALVPDGAPTMSGDAWRCPRWPSAALDDAHGGRCCSGAARSLRSMVGLGPRCSSSMLLDHII